jgi:hypothetical protein
MYFAEKEILSRFIADIEERFRDFPHLISMLLTIAKKIL